MDLFMPTHLIAENVASFKWKICVFLWKIKILNRNQKVRCRVEILHFLHIRQFCCLSLKSLACAD